MGKREVRVIVVPRGVTILLLLLVSAAMVAFLYFLSGKAYVRDTHLATEMLFRLLRGDEPPRAALLAALMPVIANVLLFIPFGFLMFLAADSSRRFRTYVITLGAAAIFAASVEIWQSFLPTRVTSVADAASNILGALLGAVGGHLRKSVHVRFQH